MSIINREDLIKAFEAIGEMYPYCIPGKPETYDHYNEGWSDATDKAVQAIEALPDADDGWIPYTGHDQNIEYGRYLVQTKESMVCGTYGLEGFVFPFYVERIVAFRPLPKPYKPKEDK